ncbi:Chromosome partition protein Smc [Klebsiella oxytoca]|uniref:TipJ family phage tail tip protein n=1 Tax=Klebsiella oxytoca TaxID=571 RepID=UPI001D88C2E0|nr:carbohydrate binding domain-containing protein [Klebsiella oxytoca]CAE7064081.1 Chromosome partition protein Smc [Klebsiella oxytoca]CAH3676692.1 Chromosome partition protein Smc [Klebsiella oxytoca]
MANNIIKGRKGGSSSQRTPTEQPDDLQSVAKAKILIALGEGEFAGELTGKDIYLDGTPLLNADGTENFSGVAWEFRPGTQAQKYIQGIPGTENEISVGTEISSETAWSHTFTNTQLSAVRVRLKWPSLMKQEDDGDVVGNTVKYAIDLQTDGGAWQTVLETAVTGKTTSGYERSHRIDLPQAGSTWTLRLRKVSPDANSVKIGDVMTLQSYTEVIDAKLRYPHTALLYIEFDSSQFNGSIPQISCEPRGRVIRVPDNYNPETREYTGTWTGGFKWAWTDNPAWIYYDIVVSDRFGLGNRLTSANISKWTLYQIAQYCDQMVPDGRGGDGMEPRYLCNVYVQERNDAYTVLRDFAAIFRGMTCWSGEQIVVQADMPRDVDFNYTRANIIGKPRYSSSTSKARYTNALVSWSDPANAYADAMEPAFVPELVSRYSFNQLEVTAIGCTRQSEAHRKGLWGILTNNKDRMVEIDVGLDGKIPQPGYIIGLADELLAGRVNGGRISAVNGRVITLDRDVDAKAGDRLQLNLPSGISQARSIQSVNGRRQITVTTAYSETPEAECVWVIESDDLYTQQYRVIGVKDNNNATYTITGVAHDPDKFPRIDTGAIIDQRPISVIPPGNQAPPDGILLTSFSVVNQGISVETLQANWNAAQNAIAYEAQWRRNDGNWINVPRSSTTSFEVSGIYAGRYLVRVRAINAAEISSGWAYSEEKTLTGKVGEPLPPLALTTVSLTAGIEIRWEFPEGSEDTQRTELQYSPDKSGNGAMPLTDLAYPGKQYQQMGLQIATQFWYRARLVDRLGNVSPWTSWVQGMSSDNVDDYYQQLDDALKGSDTYEELNKGIQDNSAAADAAQQAADAAQGTADQTAKDVAAQGAIVTQQGKDLTAAISKGNTTAAGLAQEVKDRAAGDAATASDAAKKVADAVAKAETDDAAVAKKAADDLLAQKNAVDAQIQTVNTTIQNVNDSLALQIASLSAGSGEQFDFTSISYFDKDSEGWAEDDSWKLPLPITSDGWLIPAGPTGTMRSPNATKIDATAYKYIRFRVRKIGSPSWNLRLWWTGQTEQGWVDARRITVPEPQFDPATGIAVVSIADIPWTASADIRRVRLDFNTAGLSTANHFEVDWFAVGRPTPGASQAQIQELRQAMTDADSAEATTRNQLAVQLRGTQTGTNPDLLTSGLIYEERKIRVTAEKAIGSRVDTLRVDYDKSTAAASSRMDTIASDLEATASKTDQVAADLTAANGVIAGHTTAIQNIEAKNTAQDGTIASQGQSITGLNSRLDNMRVGGANLLPNSGELTGYGNVSKSERFKGNASLAISVAANGTAYNQTEVKLAAPVDGTEYVYSFYAKGSVALTFNAYFYNPNTTGSWETSQGKKGSAGDGGVTFDITTEWQRYWVKWKQTAGTGTKRLLLGRLQPATVARTLFINSPKFEVGNVATEWSEAPQDNATAEAMTGLTTRVTAAEGKLETTSNQTTNLINRLNTGNLLLNGDATASISSWTLSGSGDGAPVFDATQKALTTDKPACRVANGTKVPVEAGQTLTLSFDVKVSDATISTGTQMFNIGLIKTWSDPTTWLVNKFDWNSGLTTAWQTKTITLKIPNDFPGQWVYLRLACGGWTPAAARFYFRNFMLSASNGIAGMASAQAVTDLSSRVTKTEKDITTQAGQITSLGGRIDSTNAEVAKKATTAAVDALKATVTQQGKDITAQAERTTNLSNTVNANKKDADDKNTAQGQAITGLTQRVTAAEGSLSTQSRQITSLDGKIDNVKIDLGKTIATKADGSTVTALSQTVTQQGEDLKTTSDAVTSLKGRVSTVEGEVAKAATIEALNQLTTRVSTAEGKLTTTGQQITGINASLNAATASGGDYIPNPTFDPAYSSFGFTRRDTVDDATDDSIPYDADIPAGCPNRYVVRLDRRDHFANLAAIPVKPGQVFEMSVWVAARADATAPFNLYIASTTTPTGGGTARNSNGNVAPTQTWRQVVWRWTVPASWTYGYLRPFLQINQSSPFKSVWYATDWHLREVTAAQEAKAAADAAAGSVSSLSGTVEQQGKNIKANSDAITAVTGRVTNVEKGNTANSQAITKLEQTTTQQGKDIDTTSQALTSVAGWVESLRDAGANLVPNYDFRQGSVAWTTQEGGQIKFGDYGEGKAGVRIKWASGNYSGIFPNGQHKFQVDGGNKKYRIVVKAKKVSGAGNLMVRRWAHRPDGTSGYEQQTLQFATAFDVKTYDFNACPDGTVAVTFGIYCFPDAAEVDIDYVAIYDITDAILIAANTSATQQLTQRVTKTEQDIIANAAATTAVSSNLTAALADIDNKMAGNLVANGGFERGLDSWTQGSTTVATVIDAQSPHSGGRILKLSAHNSAQDTIAQKYDIPIQKGRTYKLGGWIRADGNAEMPSTAQGNNKIRMGITGQTNPVIEVQFDPKNYQTGSQWTEISKTWKATATTFAQVSFMALLSKGNLYVDDLYLMDVTDAVDIAANAAGLSTIQTTVKSQGDQIKAQADAVTQVKADLSTVSSKMTNPFIDGSFESYADNYRVAGAQFIATTQAKRDGSKSGKVTRNSGETGNSDKTTGTWMAIRAGGKYRFSAWVMMQSTEKPTSGWSTAIGMMTRGEGGTPNSWPAGIVVSDASGSLGGKRDQWVQVTGVATINDTHAVGVLWVSCRGTSGGTGYSLFIDNLSIVDVTDAQDAKADAKAAADATTALSATVTQQGKDIKAQAGQITSLVSRVGDAESRITRQDETIAANGLAMTTGFNQMRSMIGDNSAAITTTSKTVADLEKSTTEQITTLTSQVGDMSATVQQTASTVADLNGKLGAQWGVKVNTSSGGKNYVAGIQLGINGSGQSQFLVQADQFGVYVPNGDKSNLVFGVDGNGAYMQQAMARNLVIDFAQISNNIQSTNWNGDTVGWAINKAGSAVFNNVTIRGHVEASSGSFTGTVRATDGYFNGTVYANKIEGDVMIGEVATLPFVEKDMLGSGQYDLFYISGETFDRFLDTNLICQMSSSFRSYGDIVVSTPGREDYIHYSWDAGNDGGSRAIPLKGLKIYAAGKGQRNRVWINCKNGRGFSYRTYTPLAQVWNGTVFDPSSAARTSQREKLIFTIFRMGNQIISAP